MPRFCHLRKSIQMDAQFQFRAIDTKNEFIESTIRR
jgi:hypothetical protein